jgi:hypothetical protein
MDDGGDHNSCLGRGFSPARALGALWSSCRGSSPRLDAYLMSVNRLTAVINGRAEIAALERPLDQLGWSHGPGHSPGHGHGAPRALARVWAHVRPHAGPASRADGIARLGLTPAWPVSGVVAPARGPSPDARLRIDRCELTLGGPLAARAGAREVEENDAERWHALPLAPLHPLEDKGLAHQLALKPYAASESPPSKLDLAADCLRLENRSPCKRTAGSNPAPSAVRRRTASRPRRCGPLPRRRLTGLSPAGPSGARTRRPGGPRASRGRRARR